MELLTSIRGSDDSSTGFDRSRDRRKREFTSNKNIKGKHHLRNYLGDIFGFTENQEKGTHGLGYKLTLKRDTDKAVLKKKQPTIIKLEIML